MTMKKILILAANPQGTTRLRLEEEVRDIEEGLRLAKHRDEFELIQRWAVRPRDIQRALLDVTPQIIHFSGHGEGKEGLIFEDEVGQPQLITGEALAGLFHLFASDIDCILLNGCYSQEQAESIVRHIDYVIGMSRTISDKAAIEFAVAFYDALGAGRSYEFAYHLACAAIQINTPAQVASQSSRKLMPVAGKQSSLGENTTPILLRRKGLPEEEEDLYSGKESSKKSASLSVQKSVVSDLDLLRQAGQEHLGVLERQIALEEIKYKENLGKQLKEALEWLKTNMKKLARESGDYAFSKFADASRSLTEEDKEDFQWNIEKYIEAVYYAILSNSDSLLDEPAISPSISSKELYKTAFQFIGKKIPPRTSKEIVALISDHFKYLLSRLFLFD